ncbi:putative calcium-activated potassium channel (Kef-type K+ transport protein) [Desulforapulum autotrophicum HRM2]|uniref:Calcium-activated potassium channel (Kef-type K+ transport protein) n=1 Tax=Desulforapulum autotrophicum (strain ATCC 43914 / DSM 3382 / VKM B-1955 / HRM2) TaxID=177437 RepID=C0QB62_DESAH|nr:ion channel [Desulforapulum autotrophicum]ACN14861.1 putative calcium-activated potassium channel (Kef-type K+ transport protein) [Desulforapulum autotrophicum HRM2]
MVHVFSALARFFNLLKRENIHRVLFYAVFVLFSGSLLLMFFEKKTPFIDALWWSIVTMTTVGYGDVSPATPGGRVIGIFVMLSGIGLIGLLTATIAGMFIENKFMEKRGMKTTDLKEHFIICGWNYRGETIISEMNQDAKSETIPMVIIADLAETPCVQDNVFFVRGEIDQKTLAMASADKASVAIILSDDTLDTYAKDAKTILATMSIKNLVPDLYTCVELMDPKNMEHLKLARADEIIVVGEISTNLLVQAALDHGVTRFVSELVSNRYGNELYKITIPPYLVGNSFFTAMCRLKERENILCVGVEDASGKKTTSNPDNDYVLKKDDSLMVIAEQRPKLA